MIVPTESFRLLQTVSLCACGVAPLSSARVGWPQWWGPGVTNIECSFGGVRVSESGKVKRFAYTHTVQLIPLNPSLFPPSRMVLMAGAVRLVGVLVLSGCLVRVVKSGVSVSSINKWPLDTTCSKPTWLGGKGWCGPSFCSEVRTIK